MNQFRKNILIICEGQETEPNYFYELRNIVIAKNLKVSVTISPPPPKESEVNPPFQLRQGGKKRLLKNSSKVISLDNVEDDFKEQPTRYVRAAQIKLKDKSYDEVWAVFDKDQHPDHQRAFEIANELIDDKIVQIAFTSIAFEYWILLHFEQNSIAFSKSMCRVGKDYFFCGENSHPSDCKGANCVCGRIVQQGYLKYHGNRKKFKFSEFNNRIETAILNSVHLANSYSNNTTPIYDLNPYTSIHRLVFKLNNLPLDYVWKNFLSIFNFKHFEASYSVNSTTITVSFTRISNGTQIINVEDFVLVDAGGTKLDCGSRLNLIDTIDHSNFSIPVVRSPKFHPIFIARRINDVVYNIAEIPF